MHARKIYPSSYLFHVGVTLLSILLIENQLLLVCFATANTLLVSAYLRSLSPLKYYIYIALVYLIPLILFHGVLNAQFGSSGYVLGLIPLRPTGIVFALEIGIPMTVFFIAASYFLYVKRADVIDLLFRLKIPISIIVLLTQGIAIAKIISLKIDSVYLAQKARGVPVTGNLPQRIISLPAMLVPVVVSTLIDAEARGALLLTRGFGAHIIQRALDPQKLLLQTVPAFPLLVVMLILNMMENFLW